MKHRSFFLLLGGAAALAALCLCRGYYTTVTVSFLIGFVFCGFALFLESKDRRPSKSFWDYVGFSFVVILLFSFLGNFFFNEQVRMYMILGGASGSLTGLLWFFTYLLRKR